MVRYGNVLPYVVGGTGLVAGMFTFAYNLQPGRCSEVDAGYAMMALGLMAAIPAAILGAGLGSWLDDAIDRRRTSNTTSIETRLEQ